MVPPHHHPPPVESTLSLFCNLSEIATKMLDTFTCKGAEKQKARECTVNEILCQKYFGMIRWQIILRGIV